MFRRVPEKVIQAMEQHLQILESKKGSDDEDEYITETRVSAKPNMPKKPTVPVPIPTQSNIQQSQPDETDNSSVAYTTQEEANVIEETKQSDDVSEPTVTHPSVVVSDEDGLPTALQEEIIAAARGHLTETVVKSNEAVKRSAQHGAVNVPVHTQLGRSEHRTVSVPPTRSRSPSPARPSPSPSHIGIVSEQPPVSVSDSEMEDDKCNLNANIDKTKHNLSLSGLNQKAAGQSDASPICGSPFAGDEEPVAPAVDTTVWSDKSGHVEQSHTNQPSALDDLLGLDLLSSDPLPQSNIEPVPFTAQVVSSAGTQEAKSSTNNTASSVIDDLLSLDPLLAKDDTSPVVVSQAPSANPPGSFVNVLPAGLKPIPSTVPIRPAVYIIKFSIKLRRSTNWGTSNVKKKPLSETGKPLY
ncbi:unnamed protein product [Heterobilharzia americana]|nr:unnamed protein product [Heterobilharzia americana]